MSVQDGNLLEDGASILGPDVPCTPHSTWQSLTRRDVPSAFQSAPGEVTDFLSFYTLPSTIMNHPTHKSLKAAYSFYNVHTKTPLIDLMSDALILAKSVREETQLGSSLQAAHPCLCGKGLFPQGCRNPNPKGSASQERDAGVP